MAHSILEEVTGQKEMHFQGIEDVRRPVLSWIGKEGKTGVGAEDEFPAPTQQPSPVPAWDAPSEAIRGIKGLDLENRFSKA